MNHLYAEVNEMKISIAEHEVKVQNHEKILAKYNGKIDKIYALITKMIFWGLGFFATIVLGVISIVIQNTLTR